MQNDTMTVAPPNYFPYFDAVSGNYVYGSLNSGDTAWMLTSTALVLLMTMPGLAIYYSGMVRDKNVLACKSIFQCCLQLPSILRQFSEMAFNTPIYRYNASFYHSLFDNLLVAFVWL